MTEYPNDWDRRRKRVYQRDNYECQNCRRVCKPSSKLNLCAHHIVPKSKGGTHQISNLISLCEDCHGAIHSNQKAPTAFNQQNEKNAFQQFKSLLPTVLKSVKQFEGETTIQPPGKLKNKSFEQRRISAIQQLGQFSTIYQPPSKHHEKIMDEWIHACVEFLKFPEDGWDISEEENLTPDEMEELIKEIGETRINIVSRKSDDIISEGIKTFF